MAGKENGLGFLEEEGRVSHDVGAFILELSRGSLCMPHSPTYEFVCAGLSFVKARHFQICCCQRLVGNLKVLNIFFEFGPYPDRFLLNIANVVLNGLYKMGRDADSSRSVAVKKARLDSAR